LLLVIEGDRRRPGRKICSHMENRLHIKEGMERERDKRRARHRREENPGEQIMFLAEQGRTEAVILVEKDLHLSSDQCYFHSDVHFEDELPELIKEKYFPEQS
jgi:hypothetical protein